MCSDKGDGGSQSGLQQSLGSSSYDSWYEMTQKKSKAMRHFSKQSEDQMIERDNDASIYNK
jgi:hypothetical protein